MPITLSEIHNQAKIHLSDSYSLIYTSEILDEAVRSALSDISRASGVVLTLSGLDEAAETTLPEQDEHALIAGAVAYALNFRASGRFEDAVPHKDLPPALADWAAEQMAHFQTLLAGIKARIHQNSADVPYSQWEWDES